MYYHPNMSLADFKDALRELAPLQQILEQHVGKVFTNALVDDLRGQVDAWVQQNLGPAHPLKSVHLHTDPNTPTILKTDLIMHDSFEPLLRTLEDSDPGFDLMDGYVPLPPPFPQSVLGIQRSPPAVPASPGVNHMGSMLDEIRKRRFQEQDTPSEGMKGWNDNPFED